MEEKNNQSINKNGIEELLQEQTTIILNAVDEKLQRQNIVTEQKLQQMETRINKKIEGLTNKINELTTTLDKFLKRLTIIEEEFEMMKLDINKVKQVLKEKLGVDLL